MPVYVIIGNSSIKVSAAGSEPVVLPADASAGLISPAIAGGEGPCVAASVNPGAESALQQACGDAGVAGPLYAGRDFPTGVTIRVKNPETVGVDRILNLRAAFAEAQAPCAAVDLGTAVSISVADRRGRFIGGAILPGLSLGLESLARSAALLPRVGVDLPPSPLGDETKTAMQSGVVYGSMGAVKEIVERISAVLGRPLEVFLTGRDAALLKALAPAEWRFVPALTLEGLTLAYTENAP
ncbi:MAG: type III pantothenate kinase [Planctomycetota bacterium]